MCCHNFDNMKGSILYCSLLILFIVGLASCKKTKVPPNEVNTISVDFSAQTIDISKVDSVVVSLKKPGTNRIFTERLDLIGNSYRFELKAGQRVGDIVNLNVYSKQDERSRRKYLLKKEDFNCQNNLSGPIIAKTDKWMPYILLFDAAEHIELVLSERHHDPQIELNFPASGNWDYIKLDRMVYAASGGILDSEVWTISGTLNGQIRDTQGFSAYCSRVKDLDWKEANIFFMIMKVSTGEERLIYYPYDQRY